MSGSDNPAEQSMEEILASIRKIIAEEPIGTRSDGARGQAGGPAPSGGAQRTGGAEPISLDDALGLSEAAKTPAPAPAAKSNAGPERRWSFSNPFAQAAANQQQARGATTPETQRSEPEHRPLFSPAPKDAGAHNGAEANGSALGGGSAKPGTNGAAALPEVDSALLEAREKVERHLGRASGASQERAGPAALGLKSIRDAASLESKPVQSQRKPAPDGLVARTAAAIPSSDAMEPYAPAARTAASRAPTGARAETNPQPAANGSANGSVHAGEAADGAAAKPSATQPERQTANKPDGAAAKDTGTPSAEASRALEAAVTELLRPMLREWLDANLPRMVQQVLREEVAKSPPPEKGSE